MQAWLPHKTASTATSALQATSQRLAVNEVALQIILTCLPVRLQHAFSLKRGVVPYSLQLVTWHLLLEITIDLMIRFKISKLDSWGLGFDECVTSAVR